MRKTRPFASCQRLIVGRCAVAAAATAASVRHVSEDGTEKTTDRQRQVGMLHAVHTPPVGANTLGILGLASLLALHRLSDPICPLIFELSTRYTSETQLNLQGIAVGHCRSRLLH